MLWGPCPKEAWRLVHFPHLRISGGLLEQQAHFWRPRHLGLVEIQMNCIGLCENHLDRKGVGLVGVGSPTSTGVHRRAVGFSLQGCRSGALFFEIY